MWRYWCQFDCFCYIQLYSAIRNGNWALRLAAIKSMAPLFIAFDQDVYMHIIPHHLNEVSKYPQPILHCLELGGFTISLTGQQWCSVALDEAHEMKINKDLKSVVITPTADYLQKTSAFLNYRVNAFKNFTSQVLPDKKQEKNPLLNSKDRVNNENVNVMQELIREKKLFMGQITNNRGLANIFNNQTATPQQAHDMLNFRATGEHLYKGYITHRVLMEPSTSSAPVRKAKLLTMAPPKKLTRRNMNEKEKELKTVTKLLRRRLEWC